MFKFTPDHFTMNPKPEDVQGFSHLCSLEKVVVFLYFSVNPFINPVKYEMIIYVKNNELFFAKKTNVIKTGKQSIYFNSLDNIDLSTQMRQDFAYAIKRIQLTYSLEKNLETKPQPKLQKI